MMYCCYQLNERDLSLVYGISRKTPAIRTEELKRRYFREKIFLKRKEIMSAMVQIDSRVYVQTTLSISRKLNPRSVDV